MGNKFSQDDTQHYGTQKSKQQDETDDIMRDLDEKQQEELQRSMREAKQTSEDDDMAAM